MAKTAFRPELDGFAFVNSFEWSLSEQNEILEFVDAREPQLRDRIREELPSAASRIRTLNDTNSAFRRFEIPSTFGFCGGMAFAALDYFKRQWIVPRGSD